VPDKLGVGGVCGNAEIHHNLSIQSFLHLFLLWFNFWLSNWKLSWQQLMLCLQIFMYDERKSLICIASPGGEGGIKAIENLNSLKLLWQILLDQLVWLAWMCNGRPWQNAVPGLRLSCSAAVQCCSWKTGLSSCRVYRYGIVFTG